MKPGRRCACRHACALPRTRRRRPLLDFGQGPYGRPALPRLLISSESRKCSAAASGAARRRPIRRPPPHGRHPTPAAPPGGDRRPTGSGVGPPQRRYPLLTGDWVLTCEQPMYRFLLSDAMQAGLLGQRAGPPAGRLALARVVLTPVMGDLVQPVGLLTHPQRRHAKRQTNTSPRPQQQPQQQLASQMPLC